MRLEPVSARLAWPEQGMKMSRPAPLRKVNTCCHPARPGARISKRRPGFRPLALHRRATDGANGVEGMNGFDTENRGGAFQPFRAAGASNLPSRTPGRPD